jgi:phosphinothricin acetyltransferase
MASVNDGSVRPARPSDLPAIDAIYHHYVATSIATFDLAPPSPDRRRAWFDEHVGGPYRLWVAVDPTDRVIGYASSGAFRPRLAYRTTVEVSIYLAPESVGRGIGHALYTALFDSIRAEELHRAVAVIALPNPASVAFHTRWGFREVGRFTEVGRKFDRFWDVALFERPLARGEAVRPG